MAVWFNLRLARSRAGRSWTGSALGIDATFPYGTVVKLAGDVCCPAVAEHGKEFLAVADIPGWRDYDFLSCAGPLPNEQAFSVLKAHSRIASGVMFQRARPVRPG